MAGDVTRLLARYRAGDAQALDQLTQLVYPELKAMARRRVAGKHDLGATTLIGETFVKLLSGGILKPGDRQQFFGLVGHIMRQVVVDDIRYALAAKRKGDPVTFSDTVTPAAAQSSPEFVLEVDRVLKDLATEDSRLVQVFECRYFAGLTTEETAEASGLSIRSVERLWKLARERIAAKLSDSNR